MMKKAKRNSTEGHFSEFVDENSPDEAAQVERIWRKKSKQQKNRLFLKVLIGAGVIMAIIFAVTLNLIIDKKKAHSILDEDQDGYTVVQTIFPHLKVLVSNQVQSYETKMVRGVGIVFAELVSWIQSNIVSNQKVLYIPNENAGISVLGVALAYNLRSSAGGSLDIFVQTETYKQLTLKNAEIMKNFKDQKIVINFIEKLESINSSYDLLLVQNNDLLKQLQLGRFGKIIEIRRKKWDSAAIESYYSQLDKYEIAKGRTNEQSLALGQFYSYSIIPIRETTREEYKIILILQRSDLNLNLCPQNIQYFKGSSEKRNLIEYLRNKTLNSNQYIFYCLNDSQTLKNLAQLSNVQSNYISGSEAEQAIIAEKYPYSSSKNNFYILQLDSYNKISKKLNGDTLILVKTEKDLTDIMKILGNSPFKMLSPFNNNGCLYPAPLVSYKTLTPFRPFFIQSTQL